MEVNPNATITLNYGNVKEGYKTLRALNHKIRQNILKLLDEKKRMNVTDIYMKLRLEQGAVSQHLAILKHTNIVKAERERKNIYYSLNPQRIEAVTKLLNSLNHKN